MATKGKRPYEKPILESSSVFGADTTTCCRNGGNCNSNQRTSMGKTTVNSTSS